MKKTSFTIWTMVSVILASGAASVATEYTHIWIDQATGINHPDTNGTPDDPFKSITYALARAEYLGCPEPWHVHIGPGVYDANSVKPATEREIFPIELGQDMIFESTDPNNPNSLIIDGQHLVEGFASLLYGNDLTGLEIRGLTLQNMNHSQGNGGALELLSCGGQIERCVIQDNSAKAGGGLWLSPRGDGHPFDFISCTFSDNTSTDGPGGGVCVTGALIGNIASCTFTGNTATNGSGGGVYVASALTGNITDCVFANNASESGMYGVGGGLVVKAGLTGNIQSCSFTENWCSNTGWGSTGRILTKGGGVYVQTINGDISQCNFAGNWTYTTNNWSGGVGARGNGLYIDALNGTLNRCGFVDNSSHTGGDIRGGGAYLGAANNDIVNCNFSGNSAVYGGGFYVNGSVSGDISACRFNENAGTNGGGFRINSNLIGDIRECEFENGDSMASDDAVQVNGNFDGVMEACRFYDFGENALQLLSNNGTPATIRSCLFVAPVTLGEVSGWAVKTKQKTIISNNTMVGPGMDTAVSPLAIYIEFNTEAENGEISNNIIVESKRGIHVNAGLDMPITYNQFYDVVDIVCQGEQGLGNDIWWLEWNLSNFRNNDYGDPLFFAYDATYHIRETSPCVDSGDPNYVADVNETDIDGQPRVAGYGVDRGADEYFTYILTADIYHDGIVNFLDFAVLARYWQQDEPLADIAPPGGDDVVDFLDLGILVDEWLLTEPWY